MKHAPLLLLSVVFIFIWQITSCSFACIEKVKGSGNIINNDREIENFNKVVLKGSGNVYIKQGSSAKVVVETDDNIMPHIITEVDDGTLVIYSKESISPKKLNIYITMVEVKGLGITGSGDIIGKTMIETGEVELSIKGSGDIEMNIEANELKCEISGSGDITLGGKANNATFSIQGSGDMKMYDLETNNCSVSIFGSGDCKVTVRESLIVSIFGSGDVQYKGQPANISQNIKGSGDVKRVD